MIGFHRVDEVGSTNDVARDLARKGAPDGTAVLARAQSAGRGRRGHTWFSPDAGNLYLSYVHRSHLPPAELVGVTLDAATAVATALEDATGLEPAVRWPNDILVGGAKVAGILTELHTDLAPDGSAVVIVGVGVNVNLARTDLPEELQGVATSVREETGEPADLEALAALVARRLREKLHGYEVARGPDVAAWMARFAFVGCRVRVEGPEGPGEARVAGVDATGALLVQDGPEGPARSVRSGEAILLDEATRAEAM